MCGIFGYVGSPAAVTPMVVSALKTMEYRGYDSWGIGWDDGSSLACMKAPGRVPSALPESPRSSLAIGHTRWATHGSVTARNAHPHLDCSSQIGVVHNGVIENADELRRGIGQRHDVRSDTDSEIIAHLVEEQMAIGHRLGGAVANVFLCLQGSNAIVVCDRRSGEIAAITSRSPLRLGRATSGWCLASDPLALTGMSDEVVIVPDHALLTLAPGTASLTDLRTGEPVPLRWMTIPREMTAELGPFRHYMDKEIHDQPRVAARLIDRVQDVDELAGALGRAQHVILTGCGSAYYAAAMGALWLRSRVDAWVEVLPASELHAGLRNLGGQTLVIALTQSGETADVVDALHVAQSWGATTAAIVNAESSTVARMVDYVVPLLADVERSVLATKSFLAMVVRALQLTRSASASTELLAAALPEVETALSCEAIHDVARRVAAGDHGITLGKGVGYAVALEGALKIKEGSYVHAEAFLTGELKHGPLALVTDGLPCMLYAIAPREVSSASVASHEIRSRGGYAIGIGPFRSGDADHVLPILDLGDATVLPAIVVAQRIGYEVALARGVDPDYPRNLAKSVTVR